MPLLLGWLTAHSKWVTKTCVIYLIQKKSGERCGIDNLSHPYKSITLIQVSGHKRHVLIRNYIIISFLNCYSKKGHMSNAQ